MTPETSAEISLEELELLKQLEAKPLPLIIFELNKPDSALRKLREMFTGKDTTIWQTAFPNLSQACTTLHVGNAVPSELGRRRGPHKPK